MGDDLLKVSTFKDFVGSSANTVTLKNSKMHEAEFSRLQPIQNEDPLVLVWGFRKPSTDRAASPERIANRPLVKRVESLPNLKEGMFERYPKTDRDKYLKIPSTLYGQLSAEDGAKLHPSHLDFSYPEAGSFVINNKKLLIEPLYTDVRHVRFASVGSEATIADPNLRASTPR